jgi:hypothetical protein
VTAADINYAFTALAGAGTRVAPGTTGNGNGELGTARRDTPPALTGTLATIDDAAIVTGSRISNKGNFADTENFLSGTVQFSMAPQFFTAAEFEYVVTLTIASN